MMTRLRTPARPVLLVFALAVLTCCTVACSGETEGVDNISYASAEPFAKAFGCTAVKEVPDDELGPFVGNAVACNLDGVAVTVNWFEDTDDQKKYTSAARAFGIADDKIFADGNLAVLCLGDAAPCRALESDSL